MSNSTLVQALRRRINFVRNTPAFKKYSKSFRDFLIVTGLTIISSLPLTVAMFLAFDDDDMTGIGSCGSIDCIDQ